jgi:hypothetical protein
VTNALFREGNWDVISGSNVWRTVPSQTITNSLAYGSAIETFTTNGVGSVFASGLVSPGGMAFDSAGNLFVSLAYGSKIEEITPGGGTSTFATGASGLNVPTGLAFDSGGNLYAASVAGNTIEEFDPSGAGNPFASSGLDEPYGLAFETIPEPSSFLLATAGALLLWPLLKRRRA